MSDTNYTVTRGLVDRLLANQAELMRTARIIPHEEGGRTVGVKLYGIRRNSLLGRLGLLGFAAGQFAALWATGSSPRQALAATLAYAATGLASYLVFRMARGVGRGFLKLRSYLWFFI